VVGSIGILKPSHHEKETVSLINYCNAIKS
jgi:hypothetical protein